ncbi:MAG: hypothetical protein WBL50_16635 [Candidatus Acidiferrum sp.]
MKSTNRGSVPGILSVGVFTFINFGCGGGTNSLARFFLFDAEWLPVKRDSLAECGHRTNS